MKRFARSGNGLLAGLVLVPGALTFTACDTFEPVWAGITHEVVLYSLARPEFIGRASGYDFIQQRAVIVEHAKAQDPYDFDLVVTELDGVLHLLPAGMFEGFPILPGIAVDSSGTTFEDLTQAPRDGYVTDAPVRLEPGWVYIIRSRRDFRGCNIYGKMDLVTMDNAAGTAHIRTLRNPLCNDRNLVPPRG
jgi:hypothetical protein